jgi:hypothetical protein
MKRTPKTGAAIVAALSLAAATAAFAQPGPLGSNAPHDMPCLQDGKMGPMQHGMMGRGGPAMGPGQSLLTPEERIAFQERIHNGKTTEERQKLALAMRDEMQKRAKERGITLPQHGGHPASPGPDSGTHAH